MTPDLRQVLHDAAAAPRRPLDLGSVIARNKRRRNRRLGAATLTAAGLLAAAVAGLPSGQHQETQPQLPIQEFPLGWSEIPHPPEVRHLGATAWAGDKLVVWGGTVPMSSAVAETDGMVFDGGSREWAAMADSPLAARIRPAAAWTGAELLVWGGAGGERGPAFDDGAAYDPAMNRWRPLPAAPLSARAPLSVWTGTELIVWGTAVRRSGPPPDGAAFDPVADTWRRIADAPIELTDAAAAWTGSEMIVFGAALYGGNVPTTPTAIGAAYDPSTDSWRLLPESTLSPQASTAAWNGRELIASDYESHSAAYNPATHQWRPLPDIPIPAGECAPTSVAVGDYVVGGYCGPFVVFDPSADRWHEVTPRGVDGWWIELVAADDVAFVMGRDLTTGSEAVLAYRP